MNRPINITDYEADAIIVLSLVSSLHCLPVQNYDDSNRSGAVHALHVWLQEVAVVAVERGRRHEVVAAQVGRGLVQLIVPVSDNGLARGQGDAAGELVGESTHSDHDLCSFACLNCSSVRAMSSQLVEVACHEVQLSKSLLGWVDLDLRILATAPCRMMVQRL